MEFLSSLVSRKCTVVLNFWWSSVSLSLKFFGEGGECGTFLCVWQQNSSLLWYRIFERCRFRLQRTECQWEYFAGNVFFLFWFVEYWLKKLTNRCSVLTHCYSEACIYTCAFLFLFSFDSWDTFIFVWITSKCFVLLTLVICTWFVSLFLSGKRWYAHLHFLYIKIIIICNFNV